MEESLISGSKGPAWIFSKGERMSEKKEGLVIVQLPCSVFLLSAIAGAIVSQAQDLELDVLVSQDSGGALKFEFEAPE